MPSDLRIIAAGPEDWATIQRLAATIWWTCYPAILPEAQIRCMLDRWYARDELERHLAGGQVVRLALLAGRAVGFASGVADDADLGGPVLHRIYVDPAAQGGGIGRALAEDLASRLDPSGRHDLRLCVNRRNVAAINAYIRWGFTIERWVDRPLAGTAWTLDDYVMIRKART